jgi:hypothetical protein
MGSGRLMTTTASELNSYQGGFIWSPRIAMQMTNCGGHLRCPSPSILPAFCFFLLLLPFPFFFSFYRRKIQVACA